MRAIFSSASASSPESCSSLPIAAATRFNQSSMARQHNRVDASRAAAHPRAAEDPRLRSPLGRSDDLARRRPLLHSRDGVGDVLPVEQADRARPRRRVLDRAVSSGASTIALLLLSARPGSRPRAESWRHEVAEGFRFVRNTPWLSGGLVSSLPLNVAVSAGIVLLPFLVKNELHASAKSLG